MNYDTLANMDSETTPDQKSSVYSGAESKKFVVMHIFTPKSLGIRVPTKICYFFLHNGEWGIGNEYIPKMSAQDLNRSIEIKDVDVGRKKIYDCLLIEDLMQFLQGSELVDNQQLLEKMMKCDVFTDYSTLAYIGDSRGTDIFHCQVKDSKIFIENESDPSRNKGESMIRCAMQGRLYSDIKNFKEYKTYGVTSLRFGSISVCYTVNAFTTYKGEMSRFKAVTLNHGGKVNPKTALLLYLKHFLSNIPYVALCTNTSWKDKEEFLHPPKRSNLNESLSEQTEGSISGAKIILDEVNREKLNLPFNIIIHFLSFVSDYVNRNANVSKFTIVFSGDEKNKIWEENDASEAAYHVTDEEEL